MAPTSEWTQENFRLPQESGEVHGFYDIDEYAPYLHGIAAALDDPEVQEVAVMKAAQIGWTYFLIAWIFRMVAVLPCVIIGMFAKEGAAKQFHDEKLVPAIKSTPLINRLISTSGSRKSVNTTFFKAFRGGFLKLVGSKSVSSVKSTTAKVVFVEEPDDSTDDLGKQGNAIKLLWERVKRTRYGKKVLGGTPSIKGLSKVEDHIKRSDQRVLPIVCHDCKDKHVLTWDGVHWLDSEDGVPHEVYGLALPDTAVYTCPFCGSAWDDYRRKSNIRQTVRDAIAANDPNCGWVATAPFHGVAGFKELSELYSCLPGAGLQELVIDFLSAEHEAANGDETERIVFVNSKLARCYEYQGDNLNAEELREKALDYPEHWCPAGGLLLTIGIDVQHNRVAVVRRAWGRGEQSWGLTWTELFAKSSTTDRTDPVWKELENFAFGPVQHASGSALYASAISIDSSDGGTNDAVYDWVRAMNKKHPEVLVMAIKGSSSQADPEIFVTPRLKGVDHQNPKKQSKADKRGLKVYIVGTNKAKDYLASHMKLAGDGPGRHHVSKHVRQDYFEQVTGEVKAPHRTLRNRKVWQQRPGCPVEAWDCEVYALHAAYAKRIHLKSPADWDMLQQKLLQADLFSPSQAAENFEATVISNKQAEAQRIEARPAESIKTQPSLADIARRLHS